MRTEITDNLSASLIRQILFSHPLSQLARVAVAEGSTLERREQENTEDYYSVITATVKSFYTGSGLAGSRTRLQS